ncbi:MAG: hypothetical protein JSW04_00115 [Desulfobacterales bacterium]|nr:MAG: hypothetical protein JSW04_00115 [Desulfobacterales bacterium]
MLQRYDISLDSEKNLLLIKEFAVLGRKSRYRNYSNSTGENYSFIHEESYKVDIIRKAISTGRESLITELRSDNFFPIHSCVKIIAEKVIELFEDNSDPFSEVFFNDRALFSKNDE